MSEKTKQKKIVPSHSQGKIDQHPGRNPKVISSTHEEKIRNKNVMGKKSTERKVIKNIPQKTQTDDSFETYKKELECPLSEQTLASLDEKVVLLDSSKNLSEKIKLHNKLKEKIQNIGTAIDDMVEIVDTIDPDAVLFPTGPTDDEIKKSDDSIDDIDDIVNVDTILAKLEDEQVLQVKLKHLETIIQKINKCKSKYGSSKMRVFKCS